MIFKQCINSTIQNAISFLYCCILTWIHISCLALPYFRACTCLLYIDKLISLADKDDGTPVCKM